MHIIGTTGLSAADEAKIKDAAKKAVIVKSGNMSLGVNLLAALTRRVAKTLDNSFDIEILEMHHNQKVDAPSGTALLLGRAAAEGRGIDLDKHSVKSRDGHTGARKAGDIGFATLRGGTVVGEHSVIFAGPAERIELTHKAEDRMIFARGALHAALWARRQKPGLYSMMDVLADGLLICHTGTPRASGPRCSAPDRKPCTAVRYFGYRHAFGRAPGMTRPMLLGNTPTISAPR